jgi:hypothetical protein
MTFVIALHDREVLDALAMPYTSASLLVFSAKDIYGQYTYHALRCYLFKTCSAKFDSSSVFRNGNCGISVYI